MLSMDLILCQDKIKLLQNEQTLAVQLSLKQDKNRGILLQQTQTIDLYCVIDISGSMRGRKMEQVKSSLKLLLDVLKPDDRISLIIFNDESKLILAPKKVGISRKVIEVSINKIKSCGSTNVSSGIKEAFRAMKHRKTKNSVTGVFLLSDGIDVHGSFVQKKNVEATLERYKNEIYSKDFNLHTFGYGPDHDGTLLDVISFWGDGKFNYIKDLDMVVECFADCLGNLFEEIAKNCWITISLKPNVVFFPKICFGKTYGRCFSGEKETQRLLRLKSLQAGFDKNFIFEIKLNGVEPVQNLQQSEIYE